MLAVWGKPGRDVPFLNVGVEVAPVAAADCLDKIGEVAGRTFKFFDLFARLVEGRGAGRPGNQHIAPFALHHDPDLCALELIHLF